MHRKLLQCRITIVYMTLWVDGGWCTTVLKIQKTRLHESGKWKFIHGILTENISNVAGRTFHSKSIIWNRSVQTFPDKMRQFSFLGLQIWKFDAWIMFRFGCHVASKPTNSQNSLKHPTQGLTHAYHPPLYISHGMLSILAHAKRVSLFFALALSLSFNFWFGHRHAAAPSSGKLSRWPFTTVKTLACDIQQQPFPQLTYATHTITITILERIIPTIA